MSAANRRFSGGGDSALAFIPGSAMRFRRKETVQLLKLLVCTAISEKGDSALAWILGSALPFREKVTVQLIKLLGCTAISGEGDSALAWILGSALPFRRKVTVHFPLFPDSHCHSSRQRQCTFLYSRIRNAISKKGDSALSFIPGSAMHFRERHQ